MNDALEQEFDFYRGAGRGAVLDQLLHLAAWARSLLMLTGPDGAGKTLLLQQTVDALEAGGRTVIVRPPVGFLSTGHELLRHVVADLGARLTEDFNVGTLRRMALQHIAAEAANERSTLLLLDDAHELSADVLRTVVALVDEAKDTRALNVVLAGGPTLPEQLRKATPARENWHEIKLKPFALNDARAFLRERVPQAASKLDASRLQGLMRRTEGWPGRLLAEVAGDKSRPGWRPRRIPIAHVAALFALVAALGAVMWWQRQPADEPLESAAATTTVESVPLPGQTAATDQPAAAAAAPSTTASADISLPLPDQAPPPVDPRAALPPSQRVPVPKPPDELTMPQPPRPAPTPQVAAVPTVPVERPTAGTASPQVMRLPKPEPSPAAVPAPDSPAAPTAAAIEAEAPRVTAAPRAGGDGWLRDQPPANYTVQVHALGSASAAQAYVRARPSADLRVVRTVRDGSDRYVIVKGSYRSRAEAQAAARTLGGGGVQPWVRTLDGIQKDAP